MSVVAASSGAGTEYAGCDAGGGTEPLGGYSEEGGGGHGVQIAPVKETSVVLYLKKWTIDLSITPV